MSMDFVIAQETEGKGRSFKATLGGFVRADGLWEAGSPGENLRPAMAVILAGEDEIRPVVANLRMGKKATFLRGSPINKNGSLEFLKSAKYQVGMQRTAHGVAATFVVPDLFVTDPGMTDPKGITFSCLLSKEEVKGAVWDRAVVRDFLLTLPAKIPGDKLELIVDLCPFFVSYLDRRTRCPLVADPRFYGFLLLSCLGRCASFAGRNNYYYRQEWGESTSYREVGLEELGFYPGVCFSSRHDEFETLLKEVATAFFQLVGSPV